MNDPDVFGEFPDPPPPLRRGVGDHTHDLLIALKAAVVVMSEFGDVDGFRNLPNEDLGRLLLDTLAVAREAIAKAEGARDGG
jgi:hypothetical protein